jgi:hypothetical protein
MDPLYNPLGTHPIQTGREMSMKPYPNRLFGFIDDPDRQSGSGSGSTGTRTRSDGPDPLLTQDIVFLSETDRSTITVNLYAEELVWRTNVCYLEFLREFHFDFNPSFGGSLCI